MISTLPYWCVAWTFHIDSFTLTLSSWAVFSTCIQKPVNNFGKATVEVITSVPVRLLALRPCFMDFVSTANSCPWDSRPPLASSSLPRRKAEQSFVQAAALQILLNIIRAPLFCASRAGFNIHETNQELKKMKKSQTTNIWGSSQKKKALLFSSFFFFLSKITTSDTTTKSFQVFFQTRVWDFRLWQRMLCVGCLVLSCACFRCFQNSRCL